MSFEREKETSQERPQGAVTELPMPVDGITNQIFADILVDRTRFIRNEFKRMQRENPALHEWLLAECMTLSTRDLSLDWALAYYAIYSRSALKRGKLMPIVSEELISADYAERVNISEAFKNQEDLGGAVQYLREEKEGKKDKIIDGDSNRSYELFVFWSIARLFEISYGTSVVYIDTRTDTGIMPVHSHSVLDPLFKLAAHLHSQIEANRLKAQFPSE